MGFFDSLVGWAMAPTNAGAEPQQIPTPDFYRGATGQTPTPVPLPGLTRSLSQEQQQPVPQETQQSFPSGRSDTPTPQPGLMDQAADWAWNKFGSSAPRATVDPSQDVPLPPSVQQLQQPRPGMDSQGIQQSFPQGRQDVPMPPGTTGGPALGSGSERPFNVPTPQPRPTDLGGGDPTLNRTMTMDRGPTTSQGADVSVGSRQGVPGQTVPTPPANLGQGLNLAQRLGISMDPARVERMKASLGAGLKSVGDNWNKPGLAAFAGSAGAALQGDVKEGDTQEERKLKATNQYFTQSSTAFNDMLKSRAQDNQDSYRAAQSEYLRARAQAAQLGATGAGKVDKEAWQKSDVGRLHMADQAVKAWEDGQRKDMTFQKDFLTPEKRQGLLDKFGKDRDEFVKQTYKKYGVDPEKAELIRTRGQSFGNPFKFGQDYKNEAQFNAMVPVGGHYILPKGEKYTGKDGKEAVSDGTIIMIRTKPPPGSGPQSQVTQPTYDDYAAMNAGG